MRDFLDAILAFIGSESLTEDEWGTITLEDEEYTAEVYEALKAILEAREGVSNEVSQLTDYFQAKGVEIEDTEGTPRSNILIGGSLC